MEAINPKTVIEAVKSPSPAIGFFYQDSPQRASAILVLLITDLVKFLNVGKSMNDEQVVATIKMILEDEELRSLKPDDFKLFFTRMKNGFYGKFFDRMDGQVILQHLYEYLNERVTIVEDENFRKHRDIKEGKMSEPNKEGQKKLCEMLRQTLKTVPAQKREVIQTNNLAKAPKEKSERDVFIQSCFDDFHKLYMKSGIQGVTGIFVEHEGKNVDSTEYVQARLKEYDLTNQPLTN